MKRIIAYLKRVCGVSRPKVSEFDRGHIAAYEKIFKGDNPFRMYTQSLGALDRSRFDAGWQSACLDRMSVDNKRIALEL